MTLPRWTWVVALTVALGGLATLLGTSLREGLVYYRTPSELVAGVDGGTVRVGGMVVVGSSVEADDLSSLVLTDGATDVVVRYAGRLPDVLVEGEGAVVEGAVAPDGAVEADRILLRHSNEYEAPEDLP